MRLDFPDTRIVAIESGQSRCWGDFRRAVEAVRQRNYRRAVLIEPDGYRFLVGLFGLLATGAAVVLPANAQPATLEALDDPPLRDIPEDGSAPWDGEIDAESGRLEFFTSGSTGAPKRIVRTLGELAREIAVLEARWGETLGPAPVFGTVSHQHIFGLTFRLLWPLLAGRPFARFAHDLWEPLLAGMPDGAALVASPAHLSRLGGLVTGPRLAGLFTAGAPLPREAAQQSATLFGRFPDEIYGSTETGAIATRRQEESGSAWGALPGIVIAAAEDGHLRLQSPYAGCGDWVDVPDRITIDAHGFHLLGRLDRIAKIAGKRIDLDVVEAALLEHPMIAEAAVIALGKTDTELCAVAVLAEAGRAELARAGAFRLSRRLRADLAPSQETAGRPRRWRFVEALPRGEGLGKLSRAGLAALFEPPADPVVLDLRQAGSEAELDIEIPAELRWFDGHFPGAPVLPGVIQIGWALEQGRRLFGLTQPAAREFQVKFKTVIQPGDRLTLRLALADAPRRLKFVYDRAGTTCSNGSIVLDAP